MDNSNISWTDGTWNPWYGCDKVGGPESECANCYIGRELRKQGRPAWGSLYKSKTWWDPLKIQRRAAEFIAQHGRRYRMFTCSLSDFFHKKADKWRPEAWEVIRQCPDVDFLILTKRAHLIAANLPKDWGEGWPNVWLGVSVGRMHSAHRIDKLRAVPAKVRFVSAEPLLESLAGLDLTGIHWLIAGGESGDNYRYMDAEWAEELRQKCESANVAFFFKQGSGSKQGMHEDLLGQIHHNWPEQSRGLVQITTKPEPSFPRLKIKKAARVLGLIPKDIIEPDRPPVKAPKLIAKVDRIPFFETQDPAPHLLSGKRRIQAQAEIEHEI